MVSHRKRLASVVFCTTGVCIFSLDPDYEVTCPTRKGRGKLPYHPSLLKTPDETQRGQAAQRKMTTLPFRELSRAFLGNSPVCALRNFERVTDGS